MYKMLWIDDTHADADGVLQPTWQMRCCRQSWVWTMTEKAFPAVACRGSGLLLPTQASFEQAEA